MQSVYNMTIATLNKVISGAQEIKQLQESVPPHVVICGVVTEIENSTKFVLHDGTDQISIELKVDGEELKTGELVRVIAISNKATPFRPLTVIRCQYGEELVLHYEDCCLAATQQPPQEEQFAAFMDNMVKF